MVTAVVLEIIGAVMLAYIGRYYWIHAKEFCRRGLEHSQRVRQPWRSFLYPQWFYGTRYCFVQMRVTGFGDFVMAALLLLVALLTILTGGR
jgi:hypothetical protein